MPPVRPSKAHPEPFQNDLLEAPGRFHGAKTRGFRDVPWSPAADKDREWVGPFSRF